MSRKTSGTRTSWSKPARSALAIVVMLVLSISVMASDLRAYFDRKSVYEGDTVTLVIESTSGTLGQPDLSALSADFDLLGTSQSTNISIVNGRRTDTVRLLVTLAPKRVGTIEVPPISIDGEQTQPLSLQVSDVPDSGSGIGGDVSVELDVDLDTGRPLVQQQVPLTVRLFTAVPLLRGNLEDPRVEGALVTKLGEDRHYSTRRDGRDYQVVERHYSLSPERSGKLRIPPVAFEGSVRSTKGPRRRPTGGLFNDPFFDHFFQDSPFAGDPFGMFDRGEPVRAHSHGITLDVSARPGDYGGDHWLPAEELQIVDSWEENPPELRVGEPVSRTLTLRAKGLSGPQIPEIAIPAADGIRVYPEKPETETRSDGETVYGISRQSTTLIPSKSGELDIPEIRVTWWDTVEQRERVATVPGWTLNVGGGDVAKPAGEPEAQPAPTPVPRKQEDEPRNEPTPEPITTDSEVDRRYFLAGGAVLVLLFFAGLAALRRYRRRRLVAVSDRRDLRTEQQASWGNGSAARKALHIACEASDPRAAASALLDWVQATWPRNAPRNLGTLSMRLARGGDEVRDLERRLYAPGSGTWDGAALWQALQGGLSEAGATEQTQSEALEPLYPRRT